jgi:NADH-quinone oxidoreductase subunit N
MAVGRRWLVAGLVELVETPPTAVFAGKLAVFSAAWDGAMIWVAVLAAINTVADLFYHLRWIAAGAVGIFADPSENVLRKRG